MGRIRNGSSRRSWFRNVQITLIRFTLVFAIAYAAFVMNSLSHLREKQHQVAPGAKESSLIYTKKNQRQVKNKSQTVSKSQLCTFRDYPKRRYYGLQEATQPDFLKDAEYVHGQLPSLLTTMSTPRKLCVNQTEWHSSNQRLPFADGTNPSILALERVSFPSRGAKYLATLCMTNSQCSWKDTEEEKRLYHISSLAKPSTVRTVLLWLNEDMETLHETTILLERDALWGKHPLATNSNGSYKREPRPLDDARLFFYNNTVWLSFRDGPNFGYDKQVMNPLHVLDGSVVVIRASESVPFCCGRNMALLEQQGQTTLQSLTWVDPVTVINVDVFHGRRLTQDQRQRKSHFHGTNAFLVPYRGELLGMGHFHRPPGRGPNEYARHGHHYTHALFTISAAPPYKLERLSREFVFPSKTYPQDADIIQFASGLELDVATEKVVIAYGINDCEGAVVHVDMKVVQEMLLPVKEGQQVLDLMRKLDS